jgi:hypothetical protein
VGVASFQEGTLEPAEVAVGGAGDQVRIAIAVAVSDRHIGVIGHGGDRNRPRFLEVPAAPIPEPDDGAIGGTGGDVDAAVVVQVGDGDPAVDHVGGAGPDRLAAVAAVADEAARWQPVGDVTRGSRRKEIA